ncbi:hypothetical protein E2P71_01945 [Candidatus Bathyarchaeota archaeon]|nr:hypothetical protein E2P71_01945 [Candidatus Bathyarchaeota archaeon]
MEFTVQTGIQILLAIATYLLGMAFAGSFLGRAWMGTVDVFLHKTFKMEVTVGKYFYWKYFCNIRNPPKPKNLAQPRGLADQLVCKFLDL